MADPEGIEFDIDANRYIIDSRLRYDTDLGELHELVNGKIREITRIRQELLDEKILVAVIFELERRGYTVISPE